MNAGFWKGRKVLLTGHTGFKGAWLALWLQRLGASVLGYALEPRERPNAFEALRCAEGMTSVTGDIRDHEQLARTMRSFEPEIVFHLAAQSLVLEGYADPLGTYSTNVVGTASLFQAARETPGVRAIVNVTSDKCYENRESAQGYREGDALGGYDPYSSSKACAELVTTACRNSYFNPAEYERHGVAIASVRAGNVIGGGDWAHDRLVPDLVRAATRQTPALIRNPAAVRPWQHVLEPLAGYLALAGELVERGPEAGGAWNFGPGEEDAKPVSWIADRFSGLWGDGASWRPDPGSKPHETRYLRLDCSKAQLLLDWRPKWSVEAALEASVDWYKQYYAGGDARAPALKQVDAYQAGS